MYGDFLAMLEAKSRKKFEELEFDYYDNYLYITFYLRVNHTLFAIPYTVSFENIEKFRGNYRFYAEGIARNVYVKFINYKYPVQDINKKSHFV